MPKRPLLRLCKQSTPKPYGFGGTIGADLVADEVETSTDFGSAGDKGKSLCGCGSVAVALALALALMAFS
jgi:hypothetical protein